MHSFYSAVSWTVYCDGGFTVIWTGLSFPPLTASAVVKSGEMRPECGCSSVVEHHVANVMVVGSSPITRSIFEAAPDLLPGRLTLTSMR